MKKSTFKNRLLAIAAAAMPTFMALADDPQITTPTGILTEAKDALSDLMTTALPIVGALVVSGLTRWGVYKLLRLVMKSFGFGTR